MNIPAVLLVCVSMLAAAGAAAQSVKVGVVNLARLERESEPSKRMIAALVAEFEPRNKQIAEFQKKITAIQERLKNDGGKMPAAERQALEREVSGMMRNSDQMLQALTDELEARRKESVVKVVEETRAAIKVVAEAGKFDLVLQDAAFARPSVDITDLVLKEMAKRAR